MLCEVGSVITSLQNPTVKEIVRLRDRRFRDQTGRFLIEGYRELLRAAESKLTPEILFTCPDLFLGSNEEALIEKLTCPVQPCTPQVFQKISYRDRPDGLLAISSQLTHTLEELKNPSLLIVAEAIEKPGNLGTILRSSDAVGADGVVVCDRCTDIHNPNVVRASIGTLFTQPVIEASSEETLAYLKEHNIQIVAATPAAQSLYTDVDLTQPVAIAVGTEQLGLSQQWLDAADIQVKIPMCGRADSLNVATATTVLLYEVLRQRREPTH